MTYDPYPGGGQGGYQPFPGGGAQLPANRGPLPPSVMNAVRLMYAGAALSVIGLIIGLTTISSVKHMIESQHPEFTTSQVNTAVDIGIALAVVGGLIGVGVWIWMALMCRAGKNWARITGTVFFGLDTIFVLIGLAQSSTAGVSKVLSAIVWLVGLSAVILLWQKASSAFFKPQPQYQHNGPWQA